MLISLSPVMTKGEAKTTLFPWYVYPPVEPFVARMLAGTVGRTATFYLSLTSPCRSLCLHPILLADNPTMPLVCKSLIPLLARNLKNRYISRIFRD